MDGDYPGPFNLLLPLSYLTYCPILASISRISLFEVSSRLDYDVWICSGIGSNKWVLYERTGENGVLLNSYASFTASLISNDGCSVILTYLSDSPPDLSVLKFLIKSTSTLSELSHYDLLNCLCVLTSGFLYMFTVETILVYNFGGFSAKNCCKSYPPTLLLVQNWRGSHD